MNGRLRTACLVAAALAWGASPPCLANGASPYGVNVHAPAGADLAPLLDAARAARLGWVRIDVLWSWVEPRRGAREFRVYDDLVREARSRGLEVYATLQGTPEWATDGAPAIGVPREGSEWRSFVSDVARRYRGRVKAWGVWNEPNQARFWAGTRADYVDRLLRPAAEEIRKADPDALVCGPELAHLRGSGADWPGWLLEVLRRAGDTIDVVTHHVYDEGDFGGVTRKLDAATTFGGNPELWDVVAPSVREVLRAAGAEGKPFWLTEAGWASDVAGEAEQARRIVGLLSDWYGRPGDPPWVAKTFLYELVDDGSEGVGRWGLLRPDRSPKPAYVALSTFTSTFPPYGDAAELVSAEVPSVAAPGATVPARVTLRNLGRATWTREAGHALAPLADAPLLSPGRVPLPAGRRVATGETVTFALDVTPPREGTYLAEWRLVSEEGSPFGPVVSRTVTASGPCAPVPAPTVTSAPTGRLPAGALAPFAWSGNGRAPSASRPASSCCGRTPSRRRTSSSTPTSPAPRSRGASPPRPAPRSASASRPGTPAGRSARSPGRSSSPSRPLPPRSSRHAGRARRGSSGSASRRRRRSSRSATPAARPRRSASTRRRGRSPSRPCRRSSGRGRRRRSSSRRGPVRRRGRASARGTSSRRGPAAPLRRRSRWRSRPARSGAPASPPRPPS